MLSDQLFEKLNDQMNFEFFSEHAYLALASYCSSESWEGFSNFFIQQAAEEKMHGMKIFRFLCDLGKRPRINGFESPEKEINSVLGAFESAYAHEQVVTKRFYDISDVAMNEREHVTMQFLKWFIDEQVEEESTFDSLVSRLRRIGNDGNALLILDSELGKRGTAAAAPTA
ncbi:MAG: ferritin [Gorillibacterium sp.]|nr:ferritin [Gorillibacterium sp.]